MSRITFDSSRNRVSPQRKQEPEYGHRPVEGPDGGFQIQLWRFQPRDGRGAN